MTTNASREIAVTRRASFNFIRWVRLDAVILLWALCAGFSHAAIVEHDTLEVGLAPLDDALIERPDFFDILASDAWVYDDNVYRLAPSVTNLAALPGIGPAPRRGDYIDSPSLEATGQYSLGRQIFVGDFRVDDNIFDHNKQLNNVSSADRLVWNWSLSSLFSGQIGVDYYRSLAGFVNADYFARDVIDTTDYYATGRYQIGPHWALFAGTLESATTLSDSALQGNDNHAKNFDVGTEYALAQNDVVGIEYRYSEKLFTSGGNDYHEDNARVYASYEFTEKTSIDGSVGYLERTYAASAIESFSGYTWRLGVHWKPTEKILMEVDASRNLSSYVTAESQYFVTTGGSLSLQWVPTEKITFGANIGYFDEKYVGSGVAAPAVIEPVAGEPLVTVTAPRRDTMFRAGASLAYTPVNFLILEVAFSREKRGSNEPDFIYADNQTRAKFTFKY